MIVKVQVDTTGKRLLIYNSSRALIFNGDVRQDVLDHIGYDAKPGVGFKAYHYATYDKKTEDFVLGEKAPWQGW